jgi:hypothetical protein
LKSVHGLSSRFVGESAREGFRYFCQRAILGKLHEPCVFKIVMFNSCVEFVHRNLFEVWLMALSVAWIVCCRMIAYEHMSISLAGSQTIYWPRFFVGFFCCPSMQVPRSYLDWTSAFSLFLSSLSFLDRIPFGAYMASDELGLLALSFGPVIYCHGIWYELYAAEGQPSNVHFSSGGTR